MIKNFDNYKFRCSSVGHLMNTTKNELTDLQKVKLKELQDKPKITEKQKEELERLINKRDSEPELSQTAKSYLKDLWIFEVYGREKDISNKYTEKGNLVEEDAINLLSVLDKSFYVKNETKYENNYVKGTPDLVLLNKIIDTKCSYDIFTFSRKDGSDQLYFYQLQAYMWLSGIGNADLAYCLVDAPDSMIYQEFYKQVYKKNLVGKENTLEYQLEEEKTTFNAKYQDIPDIDKVKRYTFEYNTSVIDKMMSNIILARKYMNTITL